MKIVNTKVAQIQDNQKCGEFLWCIKDWKNIKERARLEIQTSIYSDPFYSHKNGYKMCLRLDFYGIFTGKTTHFFLSVCIMKGEFDDTLQWPFGYDVRLDLLNQETGLPHISRMVNSVNDSNNPSWNEPPTSNKNIEHGISWFVKLSELYSNVLLCKDNQICIMVTPQIKP